MTTVRESLVVLCSIGTNTDTDEMCCVKTLLGEAVLVHLL